METNNELMAQVENLDVQVEVVPTQTDVAPINYQKALASYSEEERQEILALADSIDVTRSENVMGYGATAIKDTFEQCGRILKEAKGSYADQEVIKRVIELSKKANQSNDEFNNLVLEQPNFFQRLVLKVMSGSKSTSKTDKIQKSAVTNYTLFTELANSYEGWTEILKKGMTDIQDSALSDFSAVVAVEKYLIAGYIGGERTVKEMEELEKKHEETGLQVYAFDHQKMKDGYELFQRAMMNLEKMRGAYYISLAQLAEMAKSNQNMQMVIQTQAKYCIALIGQQLRNALLNTQIDEVVKGQKAIKNLSNELIKDVSTSVGLTLEDTEKAMYASFYDAEAATTAFTTILNSWNNIGKTGEAMLPKLKEEISKMQTAIEEVSPIVGKSIETLKESKNEASTEATGLKF